MFIDYFYFSLFAGVSLDIYGLNFYKLFYCETDQVMKTSIIFRFKFIFILTGFLTLFITCKKSSNSSTSDSPTIASNTASYIGQKWATLNGVVKINYKINEVYFEYDTNSISFSQSIVASPDTINPDISTSIHANLTGLKPATIYYYRVKVVGSTGPLYSTELSFTTTNPGKSVINFNPGLTYGSVVDIDNNVYKTIIIGAQTWMAENLKTTHYNNGTAIPFIPDATTWTSTTSPAYCWYKNDSVVYGALYNWYAVSAGNICPTGWHVPGDDEWTTLTNFINGDSIAGSKLKEKSTTHWLTPNSGSTNETGFTALPGGYVNISGTYGNMNRSGYWWTSTEASSVDGYFRLMFYNITNMASDNSSKNSGFSVRCLKN